MRRATVGHVMWIPKPSDRVCSNHFVDKEPTPDHPDPTIHLGYDFIPTQRIHVFLFIRNMILRNMRLRLQVLLTANSGNIEENKKPNPYIDRALPKKPF